MICARNTSFAILFLLTMQVVAPIAPVAAQGSARPGSITARLFPHITGTNGFEELVLAGELAKSSKALDLAALPEATLATKRHALADPPVTRAIVLIRNGLRKPLTPPRDTMGEPPFEMYGPLRQLARLISVDMYVHLADGRVNLALDALRAGLRIGYALQEDLTIGGLVGVAIDTVSIRSMQNHVGQLGEGDCRQLESLAREWLNLPDPEVKSLCTERDFVLKRLREQLGDNVNLFSQVGQLLAGRFELIIASLRLPLWERKPLPPMGDSEPEMFVKALGLEAVYSRAQRAFALDQAYVQLLGVHASIRRFLWEQDRLPESLAELSLGRMAVDPFTGQSFQYTRAGDRSYQLSCEGLLPGGK